MTSSSRPAGIAGHELWKRQAALGRGRLYPPTAFYTLYSTALFLYAMRTPHRLAAVAFFASGALVWTFLEYLVHRYVLHGRFADGPGLVQHFLHVRFDPLHWEHHERPWDGLHINGRIRDTLPFSAALVLLAAAFPVWSVPMLIAGLLQSYVVEEWVHHSVHFYHFKNPYFRYIKRHHLFHHSPKGQDIAYGLTNGFWDIVFGTRIPDDQRRLLYRRREAGPPVAA